jgi:hypothetical protein
MDTLNTKKIESVKRNLRRNGLLPKYGEFLTKEQIKVIDNINKGDFTIWLNFQKEKQEKKLNEKKYLNSQREFKNINKRRSYIRSLLRNDGVLPKVGQPLNDEHKFIINKISNGEYDHYRKPYAYNPLSGNTTKPRFCKTCNETDEMMFYNQRKSKCKRCILLVRQDKYKNGEIGKYGEKYNNIVDFIHIKVLGAKHRAKRKGFEFELTDEIIGEKLKQQKGKCAVTNIELTFNTYDWFSMSIDRFNSTIGYTIENTILVTRFVNIAKGNTTNEDFINHVKLSYEGIFRK